MSSITLELNPEISRRFPRVAVGGFLIEDLQLAAREIGDATEHVRQAREALGRAGLTLQNISNDQRVVGWRDAIGDCGLKPSTYKSSIEQLSRRFLKGDGVSTPLPVVNLYCAVSTRHMAPLGGYDIARLPSRRIELREGRPETDRFRPLGGRAEDMPIRPGVPVYASGDEVLCWAFNHRDSAETCLLSGTSAAVFFSEAVTFPQREAMAAALTDLASVLNAMGARPGPVVFADAMTPHAVITL